jgi:hypothetical protein
LARPLKDGVDYFPLDTDFLQDDKVRLIKSEFGAKGILILISLFCEIYRGNGYYKVWDNDSCLLMADAVGCGVVPENITQVVQGCLRRSIFNDGVFQMFGILTSAGIQRRYIRMFPNRKQISINKEYWLLNAEDEKDVPAGVLNKLTFKTVKNNFNSDKNNFNPDKNNFNATKESKVKESKLEERKGASPSVPTPPITQDYLVQIYGKQLTDVYLAKAKKYKCTGDKAVLKAAEWMAADSNEGKIKPKNQKETSFDLDEYQALVDSFIPVYKKKK